jgi:hypothetical protein
MTIEMELDEQASYTCDNCGAVWNSKTLHPIEDFFARIDVDGTVPAGQCPDCGCLCYLTFNPERYL